MKILDNTEILEYQGNLVLPSHNGDAGCDLVAETMTFVGDIIQETETFVECNALTYIEYDTGLKVAPPEMMFSIVFPRSSISNTKLALANSAGIIDTNYRGNVKLRFRYIPDAEDYYIDGGAVRLRIPKTKIYSVGDKIGQLILFNHALDKLDIDTVIACNSLPETTRGSQGFGSTGQ